MLKIFEAMFILTVDDKEGDRFEMVVSAPESALVGALLAELVLQKRILLTEDHIIVTDPTATGHPILDKVLVDMLDTTRPRKLKYWLNTLIYKKYIDEVVHYLVESGVLARKKKRLHLVVPDNETLNGNLSVKLSLKNRLREIVLSECSCEPSEKLLLAFLYRSGLTKQIFTLGERKAADKRVKKLIANNQGGNFLGSSLIEIMDAACPSNP